MNATIQIYIFITILLYFCKSNTADIYDLSSISTEANYDIKYKKQK